MARSAELPPEAARKGFLPQMKLFPREGEALLGEGELVLIPGALVARIGRVKFKISEVV